MGLYELAQLCRTGTSAVRYGEQIICRNYMSGARRLTVPLHDREMPREAYDLRTEKTFRPGVEGGSLALEVPPGDFAIQLVQES
ncbi:MAG: hypothetical protein GXP27_15725 [Planctomycetes bacterium]|nr:hypothetical protein [Planctomycetota bacterium]